MIHKNFVFVPFVETRLIASLHKPVKIRCKIIYSIIFIL